MIIILFASFQGFLVLSILKVKSENFYCCKFNFTVSIMESTGSDRVGPDWTGSDRVEPDWTGSDRIGPDWTGLNRIEPD